MSSQEIRNNYEVTRVYLPTNIDVSSLECDRLVARRKKTDFNEFDIIDKTTNFTMKIKAKTLVVLSQ